MICLTAVGGWIVHITQVISRSIFRTKSNTMETPKPHGHWDVSLSDEDTVKTKVQQAAQQFSKDANDAGGTFEFMSPAFGPSEQMSTDNSTVIVETIEVNWLAEDSAASSGEARGGADDLKTFELLGSGKAKLVRSVSRTLCSMPKASKDDDDEEKVPDNVHNSKPTIPRIKKATEGRFLEDLSLIDVLTQSGGQSSSRGRGTVARETSPRSLSAHQTSFTSMRACSIPTWE